MNIHWPCLLNWAFSRVLLSSGNLRSGICYWALKSVDFGWSIVNVQLRFKISCHLFTYRQLGGAVTSIQYSISLSVVLFLCFAHLNSRAHLDSFSFAFLFRTCLRFIHLNAITIHKCLVFLLICYLLYWAKTCYWILDHTIFLENNIFVMNFQDFLSRCYVKLWWLFFFIIYHVIDLDKLICLVWRWYYIS